MLNYEKIKNKPHSTNWGGAIVTDIDNDGRADVLVNGRYFLYILKGSGDGTFTIANPDWGITTNAFSAVDEGLCFGDIGSCCRHIMLGLIKHLLRGDVALRQLLRSERL